MTDTDRSATGSLQIQLASSESELPTWAERATLVEFFHETMKPYEDTPEDVARALDYAFTGPGGFLTLAQIEGKLVGAVLILRTGMGGYIPKNLLLFISVDPGYRGHGIGGRLLDRVIDECNGDIKLHVEYDNPAKRLYERTGFTTKYAEMRYPPK
jgi:GNAT superfamily N-acetyltransferase